MVKLKAEAAITQTYSHPPQTGSNFVYYYLNVSGLGLSRFPDMVLLEVLRGNLWVPGTDWFYSGSTAYNNFISFDLSSPNEVVVGVARISGSTESIRFKLVNLI